MCISDCSVLDVGGWAGWGFESNCVPEEVNVASTNVLAKLPIFEKGPDEMYSDTISLEWRNQLLAYAIPALSPPAGHRSVVPQTSFDVQNTDMNAQKYKENGWCRKDDHFGDDWQHSDIQGVAYFYTHKVFDSFVEEGCLNQ